MMSELKLPGLIVACSFFLLFTSILAQAVTILVSTEKLLLIHDLLIDPTPSWTYVH